MPFDAATNGAIGHWAGQIGAYSFLAWLLLLLPYMIGMLVTKPFKVNATGGPNAPMIFWRMLAQLVMFLLLLGWVGAILVVASVS